MRWLAPTTRGVQHIVLGWVQRILIEVVAEELGPEQVAALPR